MTDAITVRDLRPGGIHRWARTPHERRQLEGGLAASGDHLAAVDETDSIVRKLGIGQVPGLRAMPPRPPPR